MPMQSRDEALKAIDVGDVIFGIAAGGQEKLLLVYRADSESFSARHVTTQMNFRFGRNGKTKTYADGGYVTIVSTATLPRDAYETVIGLDRKMSAGKAHPDFVLRETEIRMLLTHKDFFAAHPLPEQ